MLRGRQLGINSSWGCLADGRNVQCSFRRSCWRLDGGHRVPPCPHSFSDLPLPVLGWCAPATLFRALTRCQPLASCCAAGGGQQPAGGDGGPAGRLPAFNPGAAGGFTVLDQIRRESSKAAGDACSTAGKGLLACWAASAGACGGIAEGLRSHNHGPRLCLPAALCRTSTLCWWCACRARTRR